jgi:glutathione S-transferase
VFDRIATNPVPWPISAVSRRIAGAVQSSFIAPNIKRHLDYLEAELGAAVSRAGLNASRPRLWSFLDRIHARDAYKRALERGVLTPFRWT